MYILQTPVHFCPVTGSVTDGAISTSSLLNGANSTILQSIPSYCPNLHAVLCSSSRSISGFIGSHPIEFTASRRFS